MPISISRNSSWTSVALITLAAVLLVTVQDASAARPKQLSKKEVVALIATAKSPEDHSRLAQYYKAEADRLEVEAQGSRRTGGGLPQEFDLAGVSGEGSDEARHAGPLRVLRQIGSRSG